MTGQEQEDREFAEALSSLLRDSESRVDFVTSSRLASARARALDARRARSPWLWALPGMLAAGLAMWTVLPSMRPAAPAVPLPEDPAAQGVAMDVLTHDEAIPVYQDLEFYQWLQDTNGENGAS